MPLTLTPRTPGTSSLTPHTAGSFAQFGNVTDINNAAADVAAGGGGVVYVAPGDYTVTSPILLPSNVTLYLDAGCTIVRGFAGGDTTNATIRNSDLTNGNSNIAVIGNGQVKTTNPAFTGKHFAFKKCSQLVLRDFNVTGIYDDWNVFLQDCTNVTVSGLYINSGDTIGEDGIHIEGGSYMAISDCWVKCGDDALAIIQEADYATTNCSDIAVTNCYLESVAVTMLRIDVFSGQTPSTRSIKRVSVSNVVGKGAGDGFYIRDQTLGGKATDIQFSNFTVDGSGFTGVPVIRGLTRAKFEGMKVINPYSRVEVDDCTDIEFVSCEVTGTRAAGVQSMIIGSRGPVSHIRIIGGHFSGATQHGLSVGTVSAVTDLLIDGAVVESATTTGINLDANVAGANVTNCRVTGCVFGIGIAAGAATVSVTDNDLRGQSSTPLINSGTNTYLRGNRVSTGPLQGRATLVGGTATVLTAEVGATDKVSLTRWITGGTPGHLYLASISAGVNLVILSSSGTDTSTVDWEIVH